MYFNIFTSTSCFYLCIYGCACMFHCYLMICMVRGCHAIRCNLVQCNACTNVCTHVHAIVQDTSMVPYLGPICFSFHQGLFGVMARLFQYPGWSKPGDQATPAQVSSWVSAGFWWANELILAPHGSLNSGQSASSRSKPLAKPGPRQDGLLSMFASAEASNSGTKRRVVEEPWRIEVGVSPKMNGVFATMVTLGVKMK